jgi:hypothetical protein
MEWEWEWGEPIPIPIPIPITEGFFLVPSRIGDSPPD